LVTGGSGFLGSNLCRLLVSEGHHVICMDNLFTSNKYNIRDLMMKDNFEFIEHDITEIYNIKVDQIYNLACPASPVHYQYDPIKTLNTCFIGSQNMLELAKNNKSRILQASTSEVYGNPEISPQKESYFGNVNTIGVRSCYDEGKRVAETLFFEYNKQYKVDIRLIRIFNTYGPGMHPYDGRVVSNFIMQALNGEDITIYGDGNQTRSFCFVDDLIEGMYSLMNNEDINGPVNIGNPNEITIKELATIILDLINTKSKIIYKNLPKDDPLKRKPDITKAQNKLNWKPKIKLVDGLKKTIQYFINLDLKKFRPPTNHTAHTNSERFN
jgi:UDP-glucuronate decarboxylase